MTAALKLDPAAQAPPPARIATQTGASAAVAGEVISIRDRHGRLVARYDAAGGELILQAGGDLTIAAPGRLKLDAETIELAATRARLSVGDFELCASRIVERAGDVFRTATGIAETQARRMRTLVERTLELVSDRTTIRSEKDTRIDGRRVLLG